MKRIVRMMVLVCLVLFSLPACSSNTDNSFLVVCGSYGVPGMICYDLKGGTYSCSVLETDSEERILFEYTAYNQVVGKEMTVYVICQRHDSGSVFFYEDRCYTTNREGIQRLKSENDWDLPLSYGKMSRRSVNISFDGYLNTGSRLKYTKSKDACCKKLGIPEMAIQELCVLDVDPSGNVLYLLCTKSYGVTDNYFVIISPQYAVSILECSGGTDVAESLHLFKVENGWDYSNN